jgi:hypothetical protein
MATWDLSNCACCDGGGFPTCLDRFPSDSVTVYAEFGIYTGTGSNSGCSDCTTLTIGEFIADYIGASNDPPDCAIDYLFDEVFCTGFAIHSIQVTLLYFGGANTYDVIIDWRTRFPAGGATQFIYKLTGISAATFEAGGDISIPYFSRADLGPCQFYTPAVSVILRLP